MTTTIPLLSSTAPASTISRRAPRVSPGHRVALVSMPWGSVYRPSLALGILKPCVRAAGYVPDVHLFNIRFAERIGIELYEHIADFSVVHAEWFFAQQLFGPKGLGEMPYGWSEIKQRPDLAGFHESLTHVTRDSAELCEKLAEEDVPWLIDDCLRAAPWSDYLVVGFTTTFAQSLASLLLAKRLKEAYPHIAIVFGGANVDAEMGCEFVHAFPWIDYVVHGEAERSFPALLDRIAAGDHRTHVPGVSSRVDGALVRGDADASPLADLNESPTPDYSDFVSALAQTGFQKKFKMRLYFESSRGCWWGAKHHCTFCGLNAGTMAHRKKDADRVYDEILQLARDYRCVHLGASDNILPMEYFSQLLPRLAGEDLDLRVFYEVKANLSRAQMQTLRAAGVREIQPGIESFSLKVLQLMRKGTTPIQNVQLLKWCHELEIIPAWNLLYGFPGEDPEDYAGLPHLFAQLTHLVPPRSVGSVIFERFSPYFFDRDAFKLTLTPWGVYRYLFPETRVALDRIAYYFDGRYEGQTECTHAYMADTIEAWHRWRKAAAKGTVICYFDKGPDHVTIHDNRPLGGDRGWETRRLCLRGPVAAIYLFCDEHRSFQAIQQMLRDRFPERADEAGLRRWLDQLVAQDLMFTERDRYLALAVRRKPANVN